MFVWSSKSSSAGNPKNDGEVFPNGYGIEFGEEYYMMMIVYEYIDTEFIDNSGTSKITYYNKSYNCL